MGVYGVPGGMALDQFVGLPGLERGAVGDLLLNAGKTLIAYDQWGEDNSRAAGMATFNIVSAVVGTKGAGAGLRGAGAGLHGLQAGAVGAKVGAGLIRAGEFLNKMPTVGELGLRLAERLNIKIPSLGPMLAIAGDGPMPGHRFDVEMPGGPRHPDVVHMEAGDPNLPHQPPNHPPGSVGDSFTPDAPRDGTPGTDGPGDGTPGTDSGSGQRPIDSLPSPEVGPPARIPDHVTDDPSTWPGQIRQDHIPPTHRFSADELSIAERLARTGENDIEPIPREPDRRTPDARVNGEPVEFKTVTVEHPTHKTVKGILSDSTARGGQSTDIIIDARRQPLSKGDAIKGLAAYLNAPGNAGKLTRVRIWGPDFDLDWKAVR